MTFDPTPPANSPQGKPWTTLALYLDRRRCGGSAGWSTITWSTSFTLRRSFEQSTRKWNRFSRRRSGSPGIGTGVGKCLGGGQARSPVRWVCFVDYRTSAGSLVPDGLSSAAVGLIHSRRIRQGGAGASDAAILYFQMLALLRKRGFEKPGWLTPAEFARVATGIGDRDAGGGIY